MENANIKIITKQLGGQETFAAPCFVETQENSLTRILYKNSGDDCELVISDGGIKMTRRGKMPLDMTFRTDGQSSCSVGEGELHARLDCFTKDLEVRQFAHGIKIKINYALMGIPVLLEAVVIYNS